MQKFFNTLGPLVSDPTTCHANSSYLTQKLDDELSKVFPIDVLIYLYLVLARFADCHGHRSV
jgi:hypothetical protein